MAVVATLHRKGRIAERHRVSLPGTLRDPEQQPFDVVVEDLSRSGFRVPSDAALDVGDVVSLGLPGVGTCRAFVVRQAGDRYGCMFLTPLSAIELQAVLAAVPAEPIPLRVLSDCFLDEGGRGSSRNCARLVAKLILASSTCIWLMIAIQLLG